MQKIICWVRSASGGQNSKKSSWILTGAEEKVSSSGISSEPSSEKILCLNLETPNLRFAFPEAIRIESNKVQTNSPNALTNGKINNKSNKLQYLKAANLGNCVAKDCFTLFTVLPANSSASSTANLSPNKALYTSMATLLRLAFSGLYLVSIVCIVHLYADMICSIVINIHNDHYNTEIRIVSPCS